MIETLPEAPAQVPRTASAAERASRTVRRWWWVALLVVALGVVGVLGQRAGTNSIPFHPANPGPDGTMAAARVLGEQGVEIILVSTVPDAVAAATGDSTLFLADLRLLSESQLGRLASVPADIVVAGNPYSDIAALTSAVEASPLGAASAVTASCEDPDAVASGRVSSSVGSVRALRDDVEVCFPTGPRAGVYAVWEQDGRSWRYLADPRLLTNDLLASDGNAALVFRALGHHARLVWLLPTESSVLVEERGASPVPPFVPPLALLGAGVVLALAVRARRMGPVVVEPLPVVIRPGEAVLGRARLYRRARSAGHAAAALRAGTARRLAARLGLGKHPDPQGLVAAVATSTGRDPATVRALLLGPAPRSNTDLVELSTALRRLEKEVRT